MTNQIMPRKTLELSSEDQRLGPSCGFVDGFGFLRGNF